MATAASVSRTSCRLDSLTGLIYCYRYCGRRFWLQRVPLLLTFFNAKHECENERLQRFARGLDGGSIGGPFFLGGIGGFAGFLPCGRRTGII